MPHIFIYAPEQKVLMVVDVIYPGWMPWRRLGVGQDIPGIFAQVEEIKKMSFDTLVAGHVARTGTHADVDLQSAFMDDLRNAAGQALETTPIGVGLDPADVSNPWALFDNYIDRVVVHSRPGGRLGSRHSTRSSGTSATRWSRVSASTKCLVTRHRI